jgi:hypothetical protein
MRVDRVDQCDSQKIKKFANISKADQHCLSCLKPWSNEMKVDES